MSAKKESLKDKFYTKVAPIITGLGAAVVILGALFKIQHYPGAGIMLIVGLGTEAVLFAMFAFAPAVHEPQWERVYPELNDEYWEKVSKNAPKSPGQSAGLTQSIDSMLSNAKVDQGMIDRLGKGFTSLSESVNKIGEISNASVATKEYAEKVKAASTSLTEMNKSYAQTVQAMSEMSNAAQDAKSFHTQVQTITKNLGALNAVYEMELQDANNHLKAMNKFYSNLTSAMSNMADASKDTEQFKQELGKLTTNLTTLNKVYGNMLSAMKG